MQTVNLVAFITSLSETEPAPLGPMYLAFQAKSVDYEQFMLIVMACEKTGLINIKNNCATLTTKGNEKKTQIEELLKKQPTG